ncbi:MAG: hypothetical protein RLZZ568_1434 [Cyanobacteriota bacterium]
MDRIDCQTLQKQVQALCDKVDTLQTIVCELRTCSDAPHIDAINHCHRHDPPEPKSFLPHAPTRDSSWEISKAALVDIDDYATVPHYLTHKDIIKDDEASLSLWPHTESVSMTPDIQIRRLTAQLTAAYHRIAALEEQIIAQRHHPLSSFDGSS